jgi:hypothetical protein
MLYPVHRATYFYLMDRSRQLGGRVSTPLDHVQKAGAMGKGGLQSRKIHLLLLLREFTNSQEI